MPQVSDDWKTPLHHRHAATGASHVRDRAAMGKTHLHMLITFTVCFFVLAWSGTTLRNGGTYVEISYAFISSMISVIGAAALTL